MEWISDVEKKLEELTPIEELSAAARTREKQLVLNTKEGGRVSSGPLPGEDTEVFLFPDAVDSIKPLSGGDGSLVTVSGCGAKVQESAEEINAQFTLVRETKQLRAIEARRNQIESSREQQDEKPVLGALAGAGVVGMMGDTVSDR